MVSPDDAVAVEDDCGEPIDTVSLLGIASRIWSFSCPPPQATAAIRGSTRILRMVFVSLAGEGPLSPSLWTRPRGANGNRSENGRVPGGLRSDHRGVRKLMPSSAHVLFLHLLPHRGGRDSGFLRAQRGAGVRLPRYAAGVQGTRPRDPHRPRRRLPRPARLRNGGLLDGGAAGLESGARRAPGGGHLRGMNNRISQSVPHLHAHVVPRRKGDGLRGFFWPRTKYDSDQEREGYAKRIVAALR